MPRSVNSVASRSRRKKIIKQAKGYFGRRKNVWTVAKNAVEKALVYAYRDRKTKKRNFKTLKEIVFEKTSFLKSAVYVSKQDPKVFKLIKYNLRNNRSDKFFYGSDFKIIKRNFKLFNI